MIECVVCKKEVVPVIRTQRFCSAACRGKWKYVSGIASTDNQYERINGNWRRYVSRLLYFNGRKRDKLTQEILLKQLDKQEYKCALSGVVLTCRLERGVTCPTNASVDRIIAGGPYTEDNIQMVCRALNAWRSDTTIEDFVAWCRLVVNFNDGKRSKQHGDT
jgi:5-methylcytosine-specific restriction endonuclease McrA